MRLNLRASGDFLERLREVRELCSLDSESAAARYLINRGLEAMTAQLQTLRLYRKMEAQFSPQELLPFMERMLKEGPQ